MSAEKEKELRELESGAVTAEDGDAVTSGDAVVVK